jgi:Secretion system C-terminal sorting domain/Putative carbohydrate metabolism domain
MGTILALLFEVLKLILLKIFFMKRINTLLLLLFAAHWLMAQTIPNGDMESWSKGNNGTANYEYPTGWFTLNPLIAPLVSCAIDSADVHGGKYAADLTTLSFGGIETIPGLMVLGSINAVTQQVSGGIPFTDRPTNFSGYFKYAPAASSDSSLFAIVLTHWNTTTNHRDSIGVSLFFGVGTVSQYTAFNAPFFYFLPDNPDTMQVIIASSFDFLKAQPGTILKIDDLSFATASGVTPLSDIYNVSYYPNPVRDQLNVVFTQYEKASVVNVYDLTGHLLQSVSVQGNIIPVKVQSLPAGMYFFSVIAKDGSVLKTDKFNKVN